MKLRNCFAVSALFLMVACLLLLLLWVDRKGIVTSDAALLAAMNDELDHIELASAGGQTGGVEVRLCDFVVCVARWGCV